MPIIKFTVADILKGKLLDAGWKSWEIQAIEGPKVDSAGDGLNYVVVFSLIDDNPELNGKELRRTFNSKYIGKMIPLIAAIRGVPQISIKPEEFEFNTDDLIGKKVDGKVTVTTFEGNLINKLEHYAPYKSTVGKDDDVPF